MIGSISIVSCTALAALFPALDGDEQEQVIDPRGQLSGDCLESAPAHFSPLYCRWIGEAPMDFLRVAGKCRAGLAGDVAGGNDVVEMLVQEFRQMLGMLAADRDAALLHDLDRHRVKLGRVDTGAKDFHAPFTDMPDNGLGHLGAGAVVGAQEEEAGRRLVRLGQLVPDLRLRRAVGFSYRGVLGLPGLSEE